MSNRLAQETSPYLLQHKDNPVDWYPWGPEALARAQAENKPILLSVGYSACHWCHVMEHECFENAEIAELMNRHFINIKVDREERPDLDQIYQNVAQAMTRSGGWPLTVFLTPNLKPFYGGTYFPPEDKYGRPGFRRVLGVLSDAFVNHSTDIAENSEKLTEMIQVMEQIGEAKERVEVTPAVLKALSEELLEHFDWDNGGFGGAPKFPNTMMLAYLARSGSQLSVPRAWDAFLLALEKMAAGGIYDQLGGGFHRYAVDATWSVPHFEKMLYDNGLLLKLYAEALLTGPGVIDSARKQLFEDVLEQSVHYLLREMRTPEGLFRAAQDADSEGEEGRYFVWDPEDLQAALTDEEARAFSIRYGVTRSGNFEHGKTVLFLAESLEETARAVGTTPESCGKTLGSACAKLLKVRSRRIPPATDTKVLVAWNGLVISGLAWASLALEKCGRAEVAERASEAALQAFEAVDRLCARPQNRLFSTFQGGAPKLNAYLDDYAFLAKAALDLTRLKLEERRVGELHSRAEAWLEVVLAHFRDERGAGYFFTSDDHEALIQRPKTIYDQAIPAGTAVALECLLLLAEMDLQGQGSRFQAEVETQLGSLFGLAERNPFGHGELLNVAFLSVFGPIVVSGPGSEQACVENRVLRKTAPDGQGDVLLVCHRRRCGLPVRDSAEFLKQVRERLVSEA